MLSASSARLLASMLARCLASSSSSSSHLQVDTPGLKLTFFATLNVAAVPDSKFPLKKLDPDVPEEDHAEGCQEEGESD